MFGFFKICKQEVPVFTFRFSVEALRCSVRRDPDSHLSPRHGGMWLQTICTEYSRSSTPTPYPHHSHSSFSLSPMALFRLPSPLLLTLCNLFSPSSIPFLTPPSLPISKRSVSISPYHFPTDNPAPSPSSSYSFFCPSTSSRWESPFCRLRG